MAIGVDATPAGLDEMAIGLDKTAIGLASALHDMALALIRPLVLTGNGLARLLAFLVQLGQVCSGRFPCKASFHRARLCPSAPATNSLKPWPALWPPTLAMKSQKPCSERWPLTAPLTQPRAALPTQPANRRRLFLCSYEGAARGESTKQRGQRATAPEQGSSRRSCAFKRLQAQDVSVTPSDEIAAALAFTMAKRLLEVVTAVGSAPVFASLQLRVSVRRPLAKLRVATAAVERSEALGSSRRSCNFHKRFCDST